MSEKRALPPMPPMTHPSASSERLGPSIVAMAVVVVAAGVICALYFGSEVLIPITLAVLLSFVLSPVMELLRRLWLPRVLAALLAVLIAIGVIVAVGGVIGTQIAALAERVPQYQTTIEAKVSALRKLMGTDLSGRVRGLLHTVESTASPQQQRPTPKPQPPGRTGTSEQPAESKPVPVVVTQTPTSSALELSRRVLGPILGPIGTLGIILVVAVFALLQKEDLRDRLIRLAGSGDIHRTTTALDDAGRRLSRYFLTQLGINCSFGVIVGFGLLLIGVPSPLLWGILGALLRFVPYIGSYTAAVLPVLLAAAVGPGWSMALWTLVLYIATELVMGNVVEPTVYGHSTGLSPFSVIIAAIFWTWMWGPIGLILSTPLTLCLVVLGRHIEHLQFLDVMLGDRPALTPTENFYQRILAGDPDEAEEQAERFIAEHSLSAYYDEVALQGLQLAAADANRGVLAPRQIERVNLAVMELVRELAARDDVEPLSDKHGTTTVDETPPESEAATRVSPILCVAGRGPLDETASAMLTQLLEKHGIGTIRVPHEAISRAQIAALDAPDVALVCISYLDINGGSAHLRFLVRRLRQRLPSAAVVIGFWAAGAPFLRNQAARREIGADYYVSSLGEALSACLNVMTAQGTAAPACRSTLQPDKNHAVQVGRT
jgi:predicted PurR-regulated permease PerM